MKQGHVGKRQQGVTLIEILLVMSLMTLVMASATSVLSRLSGGVKLEVSAWHLWSALAQARSEAMYSGRPVHLCALWMRRNHRLLDCQPPRRSVDGLARDDTWQQGVLLFADRPNVTLRTHDRSVLDSYGRYDRNEDLRDFVVLPGIHLQSRGARYLVQSNGRFTDGMVPLLVLRDPLSGACQTVTVDSAGHRPVWCRGARCTGCA